MPDPLAAPAAPASPSRLPTAADVLPKTPDESAPPAASEEVTPSLPDDLLAIPAMYGLLHGSPPAVYASTEKREDPEFALVAKHSKDLIDSGFGFYLSKDSKNSVLFNTAYITEDQLKEADSAGKLTDVAVPFDQVKSQFDDALSGSTAPGQPVSAPASAGSPPPAGASKRLMTARLKNLQPGSPTSGPSPGAGRVLNSILKPTI